VFGDDIKLLDILIIVIDISIVWFVLYKLIMVLCGTKAIKLLQLSWISIGNQLVNHLKFVYLLVSFNSAVQLE